MSGKWPVFKPRPAPEPVTVVPASRVEVREPAFVPPRPREEPKAVAPDAGEPDAKDEAGADQAEESLPKPPAMPASTRGPRTKAVPAAADGTENT